MLTGSILFLLLGLVNYNSETNSVFVTWAMGAVIALCLIAVFAVLLKADRQQNRESRHLEEEGLYDPRQRGVRRIQAFMSFL